MKIFLIFLVSIVFPIHTLAASWVLADIDERGRLVREDGALYRLDGIEVFRTEALPGSLKWFDQEWQPNGFESEHDRWGTPLVILRDRDGVSLQRHLLRAGMALCRPDLGEGCATEWRKAELEAREQRLGLWDGSAPIPAKRARKGAGQYALISGLVLHAERTRRYVYLNFGEVWKEDFTIRVASKDAKRMAKNGLDLLTLEGRVVEVRGVVFEEGGPMIEIRDEGALEIVQ